MRNSRARKIREEEMSKPEGTSHSDMRRARREYSQGHNRVLQPKSLSRTSPSSFPVGTVQTIKTWKENTNRIASVTTKKLKSDIKIITFYNRIKKVTRVISRLVK